MVLRCHATQWKKWEINTGKCNVWDPFHLLTFIDFPILYIKQSLHVANTEIFQPQKRVILLGSTRKIFHSGLLIK